MLHSTLSFERVKIEISLRTHYHDERDGATEFIACHGACSLSIIIIALMSVTVNTPTGDKATSSIAQISNKTGLIAVSDSGAKKLQDMAFYKRIDLDWLCH